MNNKMIILTIGGVAVVGTAAVAYYCKRKSDRAKAESDGEVRELDCEEQASDEE